MDFCLPPMNTNEPIFNTRQVLGFKIGDVYQISENALETLDAMARRLQEDDSSQKPFRLSIAYLKVVENDLVPILENVGNSVPVFQAVVRLLSILTSPRQSVTNTSSEESFPDHLNGILVSELIRTKESFANPSLTKVVMLHLSTLSKAKSLSKQEQDNISNCLTLIRNILYIPDSYSSHQHNLIIWNLFQQNLDQVLLDSMGHKHSSVWCTTVVQIIALIYKDQHVQNLQQLLQDFLETSDTSEDNESNTSQNSSPVLRSIIVTKPKEPPLTWEVQNIDSQTNNMKTKVSRISANIPKSENKVESKLSKSRQQNLDRTNQGSAMRKRTLSLPALALVGPPSDKKKRKVTYDEKRMDKLEVVSMTASSGIGSECTISLEGQMTSSFPAEPSMLNSKKRAASDSSVSEYSYVSGDIKEKGVSDSSDVTGIPCRTRITNNDLGYISQTAMYRDLLQGNSTSSNEDETVCRQPRTNPLKPRAKASTQSPQERRESSRQRLLKRTKENRMRSKGMVNHLPNDEDISQLLKEFTVDFLHLGYSHLTSTLLEELTRPDAEINMDKSHFLWLLTYFLKFASQLEIGLDQIRQVLSVNTLAYLTYQGVDIMEKLEVANRQRRSNIDPYLRKMHLVVTALREFINTLSSYNNINFLTESDKNYLQTIDLQSSYIKGLRQLMIILIRSFNPDFQSLQYLSDLIVCNHMLLLKLEKFVSRPEYSGPEFSLIEHMKEFTKKDLMRQYGRVLVDYLTNPPLVNDCVLTMMHHVAGDLESPESLYIPNILQTFSKIWEGGLSICEDWVDLIELIIQKFIQAMGNSPHRCAATLVDCSESSDTLDEFGMTAEQKTQLFWHFTEVENDEDPVGSLIQRYNQTYKVSFSRLSVIQSLLTHGVITHAQYMNFMYMKSVITHFRTKNESSVKAEVGSEHSSSDADMSEEDEGKGSGQDSRSEMKEIKLLLSALIKQGRESLISWLQEVLLDACRVKMYPERLIPKNSDVPLEPIPFHYNNTKQSIPLVPFNSLQSQGLQTETFILLLHKLGFLLPADVGKVFPRIPYFWSADHIYTVAGKLGPVRQDTLQFTAEQLRDITSKDLETISLTSIKLNRNKSPMLVQEDEEESAEEKNKKKEEK